MTATTRLVGRCPIRLAESWKTVEPTLDFSPEEDILAGGQQPLFENRWSLSAAIFRTPPGTSSSFRQDQRRIHLRVSPSATGVAPELRSWNMLPQDRMGPHVLFWLRA